ncbi:MAG TPA: hypothetical protein VF747_03175 [Blastocatellia bacterium]|jgi:hypothetical protein
MARGWESKAVEAQVEAVVNDEPKIKQRLTPAQIETDRKRKSLLLSRSRILEDLNRNNNARYKKILTAALNDLDEKLAQLD